MTGRMVVGIITGVLLICVFAWHTAPASEQEFERNSLYDGLHVTGTPIDIDPRTYRLTVTGNVKKKLSLTIDEIKALEPVDRRLILECPGFFTDVGIWTGVLVSSLLLQAEPLPGATMVVFTSADGSYRTRIKIDELLASDSIILAYRFDGREFHRVHGYPLRLAAGGREGSDWVKWLGELNVE